MRISIVLTLMVLLFTPSLIAQQQISDEEIINAFMECPEIIAAQEELSKSAQPGRPTIVIREMQCGAVGCQRRALVAQPFERRKVNPFIVHILGYVHIGPKGHITRVEKVNLKPENKLEDIDRTHEK